MSSTYFDASALMKLVHQEPGRDVVVAMWDGPGERFASRLSLVETNAALAAVHRNHQLSDPQLASLTDTVHALWRSITVVELTAAVATAASSLARTRALKGADATHLASALAVRDPDVVLATWDRRLHAAALASGLVVAPAALAS